MPKLHVIWDRDGVLQNNLPTNKFKIAVVDVASDVEPEGYTKLAAYLGELLLEQFADGTDQK